MKKHSNLPIDDYEPSDEELKKIEEELLNIIETDDE